MNAPAMLSIPTPDGSGQAVHPDVLFIKEGFLGYFYWMGCTPYPYAADWLENPIIRVSQDGIDWHPFPGAPDPLVPAPASREWHHADTELAVFDGVLYVFYISTNRSIRRTHFSYVSTADGVQWSPPRVVYQSEWGVSPTIDVSPTGDWTIWYVYRDALNEEQASKVYRRQGPSPDNFGNDTLCTIEIPGHVVWHLDVFSTENGFESLVTAFPIGTNPSRSRLYHAYSADGQTFELTKSTALITPTWFGWDNRMIYRSTMVVLNNGTRQIWYSASSWGMYTGIGMLQGSLDDLKPIACAGAPRPIFTRLQEDIVGIAKYLVYRTLPSSLFSVLLALRNRIRQLLV